MRDVIVIGGGHAGVEAALACARLGKDTVLYTIHIDMIATMPCNPSIGGPAKGIVVREIDALGGEMGKAADATALQFKMLNTTKGPGVQSLRVQSDKLAYARYMQKALLSQDHLEVKEALIEKILFEGKQVRGVQLSDGTIEEGNMIIMTTGTFMTSKVMVGHEFVYSGPDQEPTTVNLSQSLRDMGIRTFRLKTGTPARVYTDSIDFTKTAVQPGTDEFVSFSYETKTIKPFDEQVLCYLTYTNQHTHDVIHENLERSAMYSGLVEGVGPRYCPSIEDKIVRFADKERHQIFLEPESDELDTTYVQGFSTSMPHDVQDLMLHSLVGLENCRIKKYAYAIEYDAIDPLQCKPSLENKIISNLFTAGQINGTSGYEEAAAQGLIAGINAVHKLNQEEPLVLRRDEAYIGVMIDDLVTKGTNEPYRLLTSRAEYRLLLRHDNADVRLTPYGHDIGLISEERYLEYLAKQEAVAKASEQFRQVKLSIHSEVSEYLQSIGYAPLSEGMNAADILRRPHVTAKGLQPYLPFDLPDDIAKQMEIELKYEGYIKKARRDAQHLRQLENVKLPNDINYQDVIHLSLEAKQKLSQVQPMTMGQASRISGVNPADIAVLSIYLEQQKTKR